MTRILSFYPASGVCSANLHEHITEELFLSQDALPFQH
jgi:hypothetical protein